MKKIKNSLTYALCVVLAVISSVSLVTGFYVMRKDTVELKDESSYYQEDDKSKQNTAITHNQNYSTTKHSLSQETQQTDAAVKPYLYKVTIYEDSVAVFLNEKEKPYIKLYVDLKTIPEDDKKLLKEGIYAQNKAELIKILEDYDA